MTPQEVPTKPHTRPDPQEHTTKVLPKTPSPPQVLEELSISTRGRSALIPALAGASHE